MKKLRYAALVALFAGMVSANPAKEKMFERMDADKDGRVTRKEYLDFFAAAFKAQDKNKDGVLDNTEFAHAAFKHLDTNQDGNITPEEDRAYRERTFFQLETGVQDHVLTKEEFIK